MVSHTDSERFERSFQPNVALAPAVPKKFRYVKHSPPEPTEEVILDQKIKEEPVETTENLPLPEDSTVIKCEKKSPTIDEEGFEKEGDEEGVCEESKENFDKVPTPEPTNVISSTVSVVQKTVSLSR